MVLGGEVWAHATRQTNALLDMIILQCNLVCESKSVHIAAAGNQASQPTVDLAQRSIALRCLSGACESGQLLVDIFVNYDCDLEGANLFERLILALVRTAQAAPSTADSPTTAADEAHLRSLVALLYFNTDAKMMFLPMISREAREVPDHCGALCWVVQINRAMPADLLALLSR